MIIYPSVTDRLNTQHQAIENILAGIDNARLSIRPQSDKWNIHDNIAHLARYQLVFIDRINLILRDEQPFFGRYDASEDPEFEKWRALETGLIMKKLVDERKHIYDLVTTLNDARLTRLGIHKKFGPLNIIQWTEFFLLHEAHHIFTIFQLAHDPNL